MIQISSARTNSVMAVMIGIRIQLWKKIAWCFSGDAAGCRSMAPGVGWPNSSAARACTANPTPATAEITPDARFSMTIPDALMSLSARPA